MGRRTGPEPVNLGSNPGPAAAVYWRLCKLVKQLRFERSVCGFDSYTSSQLLWRNGSRSGFKNHRHLIGRAGSTPARSTRYIVVRTMVIMRANGSVSARTKTWHPAANKAASNGLQARVMELADMQDRESCEVTLVEVQILSRAHHDQDSDRTVTSLL